MLALMSTGLLVACNTEKPAPVKATPASNYTVANIEIINPVNYVREQEPLYFSFYDLGLALDDEKTKHLVTQEDGKILPSQIIDTDNDSKPDTLLVSTDLASAKTHNLKIISDAGIKAPVLKKQTQAEISIKEGGQWNGKVYENFTNFKNVQNFTPPPQYTDHSTFIRYEGPGVESDKVAYRVYLDWRNGFDIFGKKTNDMVLQNIGQKNYGDYHQDAPWGQDILEVGKTLGAGGYGFWNGKSVDLVSDVKTWNATIVENGALYSDFNIKYNEWKINGHSFDVSSDLSMNAGSRLVHTRLKITGHNQASSKIDPRAQLTKDLPNISIGVVKHPNTKLLLGNDEISGSAWTYAASWGKQSLSGPDSYLGMAVIFRKGDRQKQTEDAGSYVSIMDTGGGDLDYYFVAVWDQEKNAIKTEAEFKAYLDREIEKLTKAPRVKIESSLSAAAKAKPVDAESALAWSKGLADSELARKTLNYHSNGWDEYRKRATNFEYDVVGMQINALQELNKIAPDSRYTDALFSVPGSYITPEGKINGYNPDLFSIDRTKPGEMIILLEQRTKEKKYRIAADFLRANLKRHPRTSEGAFWHRITYPNQLWLDGVYMGIPFLTQYAAAYETGATQHKSFEEAVHEFVIARDHLREPKTGLYFHAWDESKKAEWADKTNGRAPQYWSRGMGWYAMALVDVLDYLPASETKLRKTLIDIANEIAPDVLRYQDAATGTWWQITDRPGDIGNYRESTASAMFTYFLAKAVNKGYLPDSYRAATLKSYQGLINEFASVHADGRISMNGQCLVAGLGFGRDGSYDYYMTEPITSNDAKGNTPFILAGLEVYKLLKK
ncbi:MAG: glycoside hydrolase family 88 protein [Gammaproteobacteria bacterium]|nr:MAG: glycoside hydrolase family 88 protein [Gammaproteobacteria bacterium]